MLLLTAIIRAALLVLAGIAEQKGWFTPEQFNPLVNQIVSVVITGLIMGGAVLWHGLEAAYQKTKHQNEGFDAATQVVGEVLEEKKTNSSAQPSSTWTGLPTTKPIVPVADEAGNITIQPANPTTKES